MPKRVFYSFHFVPDNWRVSQIRSIGSVEDNKPAADNDWEQVKRGGDAAIKNWIDNQMLGRSCVVVLIGAATAGRKWIDYEIDKAWRDGKGVLGIHVHRLLDSDQKPTTKGRNPFDDHSTKEGYKLSSNVLTQDPPGIDSTTVYRHIAENLESWIDASVAIRAKFK